MNTSAGYYQAPRPPRVPLDEVLIKLHPEGFHQEFEADGINVGQGGISMRASVLPQVGSTLRCEFESPVGGSPIQMIGTVVWAHENGPQVGEFGVRFTQLTHEDQVRIEALIQRWGRTSAEAPTVRLQLEGVGSPIIAELKAETESELSVEQPLPFLAIGNAIQNETAGRRGHLEGVELRLDEKTPKLVLSIGYEVEEPSEAGDRDTLPDDIPLSSQRNRRTSSTRLHDTPRIVRYDPITEDEPAAGPADRLRAYARSASAQLAGRVEAVRTAVREGLLPRITTTAKRTIALARRFIEALHARLGEKPRRKQVPRSRAARAHLKNSRRGGRRYLLVALIACGVVSSGWLIYLWAAAGSPEASAQSDPADTSGEASETVVPQEEGSRETVEEEGARAEGEPTSAQYAIQAAPPPPETIRGTSFGVDQITGGEKYVLRMSNPVTEMDGIIEDDGFSVSVPGSLSLSRAGPIATAHPDVEHASILNRGDFSELTLRFVAGRHPAYRVEARGPSIEITIAR